MAVLHTASRRFKSYIEYKSLCGGTVYTLALRASVERRTGSNPVRGTKPDWWKGRHVSFKNWWPLSVVLVRLQYRVLEES